MKKILLLGDSIRQGYDKYVEMAFEGTAKVYYSADNSRFTTYLLRMMNDFKLSGDLEDLDLVHWNAGLWDDLLMMDGKPMISLEHYKENVERICRSIKEFFPQAKIIFATTTPVQEEFYTTYKRYNKDTEKYNEAAVEIVMKHGGIINDLYALTSAAPKSIYSDMVHFYSKEGTELVTNQVIRYIEEALEVKATPLDYDSLFDEKKDAIGL